MREGRLAAAVNHPNSVYIFGSEEFDGVPVITMELLPGGTLKDLVKQKGPLPIKEAVDAILQVIAGLEAAQGKGVLHHDIKPSNCFVDADGMVKVGDFGLSISTLARAETQLTGSSRILGTPAFGSPEQLRGDELDVRSDIYSVGATLYYLLTGTVPFEETNLVKLLTRWWSDLPNRFVNCVLKFRWNSRKSSRVVLPRSARNASRVTRSSENPSHRSPLARPHQRDDRGSNFSLFN